MVWFQRGQRAGGERTGSGGLRQHQRSRGNGRARLDDDRLGAREAPNSVGTAAGAVAGLVAITPAAGYVTPAAAILIGGIAAVACYIAVRLRERVRVDDALDVFPVHGIGGTVGALLTGIFATTAINASGANGLAYGNPKQFLVQLLAVAASWTYTAVATFVILKVVMLVVPLRVSERDEKLGLDATQHAEAAYVA